MSGKINKKISVVIPCYNEEKNIPETHRRLSEVCSGITENYELIFIDDGSKDRTRGLLRSLAREDRRVVGLCFSRNFGFSDLGYTAGSEYATGDAVVWIDGDLQDPPELIRDFAAKWQEGYDVVYGIRKKREEPWLIKYGSKFFYRIFNKLSRVKMPIDAGDFSLMDRKVIDILNKMPEHDRFIRGLRAWAGFRQTGIPYTRKDRKGGVSSQGMIRYFHAARKGIFSFSYSPLSFMTYFAVFSMIVLVVAAVAYGIAAIYYPAPRGFLTLLMVILFIGTIQFFGLAILGEYVGRIFEEVKGRPKYIIEEIIGGDKKTDDITH